MYYGLITFESKQKNIIFCVPYGHMNWKVFEEFLSEGIVSLIRELRV